MCQGSAGATVKDQAEQVSRISRSCVQDQVTPERRASPETRQTIGGDDRTRTDDPLLAKQVLYQLSYVPAMTSVDTHSRPYIWRSLFSSLRWAVSP
jgi:hypothetical protein